MTGSRTSGAPAGPSFRIGTWNARSLCPRWGELASLLVETPCDLLVVQEARISMASRATIAAAAGRAGYQSFFAEGVPTGILALSRVAARQVDLQRVACKTRVIGLRVFRQGMPSLLAAGVYAHCNDKHGRNAFVSEVLDVLLMAGGDFIALGDWNCLESDLGELSWRLANGHVHSLDASFAELPERTRPAGRGRIDFAVGSARVHAVRRVQCATTSDHDLVMYTLPFDVSAEAFLLPPRRRLASAATAPLVVKVEALWERLRVPEALEGDLDDAWKVLSDVAEEALGEDDGIDLAQVRRSAAWNPVRRRTTHKAATAALPVRVRRLLRLQRAVAEAQRRPTDARLAEAIGRRAASLAALFPELGAPRLGTLQAFAEHLGEVLRAVLREVDVKATQRWQAGMAESVPSQRRWIRRSVVGEEAAPRKLPVAGDAVTIHPVDLLVEEEQEWLARWNRVHPAEPDLTPIGLEGMAAQRTHLGRLLDEVPRRDPVEEVGVTAHQLRRAARAAVGKAPGADGWTSADLLRMPECWWEAAAALWMRALREGALPCRWTEAKVVLIDKPEGGARPLCITAIMWRLGMSCIVHQLNFDWAPPALLGGLPQRGALHALARLHWAVAEARHGGEGMVAVSQDISKAFDSVCINQALAVAAHVGMPSAVIGVLAAFYGSLKRIFVHRGGCSTGWRLGRHGLVQGCPASPALLGCLMLVWVCKVRATGVDTVIYLDDRTFWKMGGRSAGAIAAVASAVRASDEVDAAMGFALNHTKCQLAATASWFEQAEACEMGYGRVQSMVQVLGVKVDINDERCTGYRRELLPRIERRLARISIASRIIHHRRHHVQTLVSPIFLWAAGLVVRDLPFLQRVQDCVVRAILPWRPQTAARNLSIAAGVTREVDPIFMFDWAALRALVRLHREADNLPVWMEELDLAYLAAPLLPRTPGAAEVLQRWGWHPTPDGIERTDASGGWRTFRFARDTGEVLKAWLDFRWRQALLHGCSRMQRTRHRQVRGMAKGLDLPRPSPEVAMLVGVQRRWLEAAGLADPATRSLALATGLSYWHSACRFRQLEQVTIVEACMCGRRQPSMSHLLWTCAATRDLRLQAQICVPADRAADRLLVCTLPEEPPPLPADEDSDRAIVVTLAGRLLAQAEGPWVIAVDGGAAHRTAAWSVHFAGVGGHAGLCSGEGGAAFDAELMALEVALSAVAAAARRSPPSRPGALLVLYDCKGVWAAFVRPRPLLARWGIQRAAQAAAVACAEAGIVVEGWWVPSHGKGSAGWRPPAQLTADAARELNAHADAGASAVLARIPGSARGRWACALREAESRCGAWLRLATLVHGRYYAYLRAAGAASQEAQDSEDVPIADLVRVGDLPR